MPMDDLFHKLHTEVNIREGMELGAHYNEMANDFISHSILPPAKLLSDQGVEPCRKALLTPNQC